MAEYCEKIKGISEGYQKEVGIKVEYICDTDTDTDTEQYNNDCPYFGLLNSHLNNFKFKVVDETLLLEQMNLFHQQVMSSREGINQSSLVMAAILPSDENDPMTLEKLKVMATSEHVPALASIINHIIHDAFEASLLTDQAEKQKADFKLYLKGINYIIDNNVFPSNTALFSFLKQSLVQVNDAFGTKTEDI